MSEHHTSSPPHSSRTTTGYLPSEVRKLIPTLIVTVLTAFVTSWWNTQTTQNDLLRRIDQVEKRTESIAESTAQNSGALQQNAIRLAEVGIIQNNTLDTIREIKQEQERIKFSLQGRR